jgi:hypothetical protein
MRAIRRTAISGGAAVLLLLGAAGPARATEPQNLAVRNPSGTLGQSSTAVEATIDAHGARLTSAKATIQRAGGSAVVVSAAPAESMRFPVNLPLNGSYTATVEVGWEFRSLLGSDSGTKKATRDFKVAVPPATPGGVTTTVDGADRNVTVTWEKNGEADMRRYEVRRSHNGGDFTKVASVDHPDATFKDATTADAGGEYRYIVIAYRAGVDGAVASQVDSDPSAPSTARVPDPPPPPTTAPPATAAPAAGAPGTPGVTAAPGTATTAPRSGATATPGKVDLSGFNNVQANTPRPVTPRTVALPDPGFQGTLPFDVPEGEDAEAVEGGDTGELAADAPELRELGDEEDSGDRQRSLALFAGGLLATVLLMHVLWVKGEAKRVPLEVVAPEGPPPAGPDDGQRDRRSRAARPRPVKAKRVDSPDWFVPDLGVDDGADRAVAAERKAS